MSDDENSPRQHEFLEEDEDEDEDMEDVPGDVIHLDMIHNIGDEYKDGTLKPRQTLESDDYQPNLLLLDRISLLWVLFTEVRWDVISIWEFTKSGRYHQIGSRCYRECCQ